MHSKYTPQEATRFWARVDRSGDCWAWQGRTVKGYGHFDVHGQTKLTHRVAYELAYGDIPDGMDILHRCDNPSCVRPEHLTPGTHADNMADMMAKGRNRQPSGERHPRAKLTWEQVREIRWRYAAGGVGLKTLGAEYRVHFSLISLIIREKIWRGATNG